MTYCIGYWLEKGLVLASDSRTNAGVDYISSYSKMFIFQPAPDRLFVLLAAGSLATTQAVISWISFGLVYSDLIVLKAEVGELLDDCRDAN
jgi:putative proteasome-type protease